MGTRSKIGVALFSENVSDRWGFSTEKLPSINTCIVCFTVVFFTNLADELLIGLR